MPKFLPSHHGFADVNASVVDDLDLHHLVPRRFEDFGYTVAKKVVPQVSQVQRLVGVW